MPSPLHTYALSRAPSLNCSSSAESLSPSNVLSTIWVDLFPSCLFACNLSTLLSTRRPTVDMGSASLYRVLCPLRVAALPRLHVQRGLVATVARSVPVCGLTRSVPVHGLTRYLPLPSVLFALSLSAGSLALSLSAVSLALCPCPVSHSLLSFLRAHSLCPCPRSHSLSVGTHGQGPVSMANQFADE